MNDTRFTREERDGSVTFTVYPVPPASAGCAGLPTLVIALVPLLLDSLSGANFLIISLPIALIFGGIAALNLMGREFDSKKRAVVALKLDGSWLTVADRRYDVRDIRDVVLEFPASNRTEADVFSPGSHKAQLHVHDRKMNDIKYRQGKLYLRQTSSNDRIQLLYGLTPRGGAELATDLWTEITRQQNG